jgi:hypothetical protein
MEPFRDIESFWIIICVLSFSLMLMNMVDTIKRNDLMDGLEQVKRVLWALVLGPVGLASVVMLTR